MIVVKEFLCLSDRAGPGLPNTKCSPPPFLMQHSKCFSPYLAMYQLLLLPFPRLEKEEGDRVEVWKRQKLMHLDALTRLHYVASFTAFPLFQIWLGRRDLRRWTESTATCSDHLSLARAGSANNKSVMPPYSRNYQAI